MEDLGLPDVKAPTEIYNENRGYYDWTKGWANRKMRHMNIREMAVRESQLEGEVHDVNHISKENSIHRISSRRNTKTVRNLLASATYSFVPCRITTHFLVNYHI